MCKADPTCYGLLQSTECYSAEEIIPIKSFNFLHLGIQEYFAAKYVTTLPEDEVYTLLRKSFIVTSDTKSVRFSNMWILYCGITSGQCKILQHYLTTYSKPDNRPFTDRYFTVTASKQVGSNTDSQVISEKMTDPSQKGPSSDQRTFNTETISQDMLKDPVKALYLFQCFQEARDDVLCEALSASFDSGLINIKKHRLLPHQVVSLGFFLSRSHRKWKELNLSQGYIGDHGMNILHQYLCGDKSNKQEIRKINLSYNDLTGASSHLIADIISHLQPHTIQLYKNNITNMRDIATAVIATSAVKMLHLNGDALAVQEVAAVADMMICLEELHINITKLGDHGAKLLSKGITNTKSLKVLNISYSDVGSSGAAAIGNALANNTSLEKLYVINNIFGQAEATAIARAISTNKTLKKLSLVDDSQTMDKESAMIMIGSLHCNDTISELHLPYKLRNDDSIKEEVVKINNKRCSHNLQNLNLK